MTNSYSSTMAMINKVQIWYMNCSCQVNTKELIQKDHTVIVTSICKRFPEEFESSLLTSDLL